MGNLFTTVEPDTFYSFNPDVLFVCLLTGIQETPVFVPTCRRGASPGATAAPNHHTTSRSLAVTRESYWISFPVCPHPPFVSCPRGLSRRPGQEGFPGSPTSTGKKKGKKRPNLLSDGVPGLIRMCSRLQTLQIYQGGGVKATGEPVYCRQLHLSDPLWFVGISVPPSGRRP